MLDRMLAHYLLACNYPISRPEALANPEVLEQFRHRAELARVSAVSAPRHRALYSQAG